MPDSEVTIPAWVAQDVEWASTIHAMRAPALLGKHLVETYVDFERRSIEWEMLLKAAQPWSTGERQLVALAFGMWSGRNVDEAEVSIMELVGTLDETNLGHVLDTIRIRRSWKRFDAAEHGPPRFDLAVRIEFLGAQLITLENELDAAGLPVIREGAPLSGFVINTLRPITGLLRGAVDA